MAQAPDGNDVLSPGDAVDVWEELLPAQNKSYELGLKLKLEEHVVEAIHSRDLPPDKCLFKIIVRFLQQAELKPSWKTITGALRSRLVGLSALAKTIEAAHFPDPAASRELVPKTTDGESSAKATAPEDEEKVKLTPAATTNCKKLCVSSTSEEINDRIVGMKMMFDQLKNNVKECLKKRQILVEQVADVLTSAAADEDDQHKLFVESHVSVLYRAADVPELFGTMNFHWNYLNPPLLDHLVRKFKLENVKGEMESYKSDLEHFRKQTPLAEFCRTQKRKRLRLTPEFKEMAAEFDWPKDATLMLEVVEQFRQEYASQYNLRDCAMMIAEIRPGSYIITWFIPESIVMVLKAKPARAVLKKFSVTRLDIDGVCVYSSRKPLENIPVASCGLVDGASFGTTGTTKPKPAPGQAMPLPEDDYLYVEQPSEDFFCPVTKGLLLQPHLTSCCGKHLSQEAANRIQGEGGMCPLCKEKRWSTVLNKHYQRQVNSLRVFCHHEERGCGWQGELGTYQSHVESCPMAGGPLMTELAELPVYKEEMRDSGAEGTPTPKASSSNNQLTVQCSIKGNAPVAMRRGSAISDGRYAYFLSHYSSPSYNIIFRYEYNTEEWKSFPTCPYRDSGLTIINGELTTVGGQSDPSVRGDFTNKLMTLRGSKWVEMYPPMKRERSRPAVVATDDGTYHIVIGGQWTTCVEIFDARKREWYTTRELPAYLEYPSATISGDQLYVLGRRSDRSEVGYSCSLQIIISSGGQTITSPLSLLSNWNSLPPLPVHQPTPAILSGQLVLVGGGDIWRSVNSIYQLLDGGWVEIGSMTRPRYDCSVVSQSHDEIIIVGGYTDGCTESDDVEECTVIH